MRVCPKCRSTFSTKTQFCGLDGARLVERETDPLLGETVGRFQILEPLGSGASGVVYRAVHTELHTEFAVKVIFGDLASDETLVGRLRREAQTASKIRSPYVVNVVDFGTTDAGLTYLAMEYVPGATLQTIIQTEAPLAPRRVARIVAQIAYGLVVIHRLGLVHRDIKPSNVMLLQDEGELTKLLDFGIVRVTDAHADTRLTQVGLVVGTPAYMSPEQAKTSEVSFSSDLYSLGVVMYELLSGRRPFRGDSIASIMIKHAEEMPEPLAPAGGLEALCLALLAKSPEDRPASAALVAELALHAEATLAEADPDGPGAMRTLVAGIPSGDLPSHPGGFMHNLGLPGGSGAGTPAPLAPSWPLSSSSPSSSSSAAASPYASSSPSGASGPASASASSSGNRGQRPTVSFMGNDTLGTSASTAEHVGGGRSRHVFIGATVIFIGSALTLLAVVFVPNLFTNAPLTTTAIVPETAAQASVRTAMNAKTDQTPEGTSLNAASGASSQTQKQTPTDQDVERLLQTRGLSMADLPELEGAPLAYNAWKSAPEPSAERALQLFERLEQTIRSGAITPKLLEAKLNRLDSPLAALRGKRPHDEVSRLEARYLDLYRRLAETKAATLPAGASAGAAASAKPSKDDRPTTPAGGGAGATVATVATLTLDIAAFEQAVRKLN